MYKAYILFKYILVIVKDSQKLLNKLTFSGLVQVFNGHNIAII